MGKQIALILLVAGTVWAADLESRIVRVTVYPGMALVERQASTTVAAGTNKLVLTGLPAGLADESVHARITSGSDLALEDVTVQKWFLARAEEGQVQKLEEAIRDLERQLRLQEGEQKNLATREKFLQSIQATATAANGQSTALMRPDAASWSAPSPISTPICKPSIRGWSMPSSGSGSSRRKKRPSKSSSPSSSRPFLMRTSRLR